MGLIAYMIALRTLIEHVVWLRAKAGFCPVAIFVLVLSCQSLPQFAYSREYSVVSTGGGLIEIGAGSEAGLHIGDPCEVFIAIDGAGPRRLVQVARCQVTRVTTISATAAVWDQQGSITSGYVVRLDKKPAAASRRSRRMTSSAKKAKGDQVKPKARQGKAEGRPTPKSESLRQGENVPKPKPSGGPTLGQGEVTEGEAKLVSAAESEEAPQSASPPPEEVDTTLLMTHASLHEAAERFLKGEDEGEGEMPIYEILLSGAGIDLGPRDDLLSLARILWPIHFPGPWHTCFARPDPRWCAFVVREGEETWVRVDAPAYRSLRQAIRRGGSEIRLLFRIADVVRESISSFSEVDCLPEHEPFIRSEVAYRVVIDVVGGALRDKRRGPARLLMRAQRGAGGDWEARFASE
jgi:hypothetical protein